MRKKITDISDPGGEIRQILDPERFITMVKGLDFIDESNITQDDVDRAQVKNKGELIEKKIKGFAKLANQELHEYVKIHKLLDRKKDTKKRKQNIDFPLEIEKAARDFRELVEKAPLVIANNTELLEMSDQLEAVPRIFNELRQEPYLAEQGMIDPYAGKYTDIRIALVLGIHALYSDITGMDDWVTRIPDQQEYTNPFFQLLRLCYQDIGLYSSDRTIERDIKNARKLR